MSDETVVQGTTTSSGSLLTPTLLTGVTEMISSMSQMLQVFFNLYIQFYMFKMMFEVFKDLFTTIAPR